MENKLTSIKSIQIKHEGSLSEIKESRILNELRMTSQDGRPFNIGVNLPYQSLKANLDATMGGRTSGALRGYVMMGNVYWWDAHYATHQDVARELFNEPVRELFTLYFMIDRTNKVPVIKVTAGNYKILETPALKKLFGDGNGEPYIYRKEYDENNNVSYKAITFNDLRKQGLVETIQKLDEITLQDVKGEVFAVFKNLNQQNIINFLEATIQKHNGYELRGYLVGEKEIYWWNSYYSTHHYFVKTLQSMGHNIEYRMENCLYFSKGEKYSYYIVNTNMDCPSKSILITPVVKKIWDGKVSVFVPSPDSSGMITVQDLLSKSNNALTESISIETHLNEVKLHGRDNTVFDVYKNPSWDFLKTLITSLQGNRGDIRGYRLDDKTVLFWVSYYATHHYVVSELGYDYVQGNGFFIYTVGPKYVVNFYFNRETDDDVRRVLNSHVLKVMWLNDPDVFTDWEGTSKLVPIKKYMDNSTLANITNVNYISTQMNNESLITEMNVTAANGQSFPVYKNLSWSSLETLFSNNKEGHALRGLIDGHDVYWWYAFYGTHDLVSNELLGHSAKVLDSIIIEQRRNVDLPVLMVRNLEVLTHPQLRKLFGNGGPLIENPNDETKLFTFAELLKNNLVEARWGAGKFVGAKLTHKTEKNIRKWLEENSVDALGCEDLHVTVILDKKRKFPWDLEKFEPAIEVKPESFRLDLFGPDKDVLVLKFHNDVLEKRHYEGREEHGIKWDYDNYHPHLTLCYKFKGNIDSLPLPTFSLFLDHEYTKPFKDPSASLKS